MDADAGVEPELDTFTLILPLPYRVALVLVAGVWAWGVNLQYLKFVGIVLPPSLHQATGLTRCKDVPALIRYPARQGSHTKSHHASTYRLAVFLTIPLALSLLLFWTITHGSSRAVIAWDILPQLYLFLLMIFFALPFFQLSHSGRSRFLSTLRRVSVGGLAEAQDGKFGDIILADVLTSYAKVLGELFVCICMFFSRGASSTDEPNRSCGGAYAVPLIISIPSFIRLRQCLIEYLRVRKQGQALDGWGGQHLANALKYATAFPVIALSAMQRGNNPATIHMSQKGLFRLWLLSVFVNSSFSFYWDIAKDWDLSLLSDSAKRNDPEHPYGLRRHRFFHSNMMYYTAISIDFLLRCTWSVKLSPHLDHFNDLEGGIFTMEILEVVRRWLWIFLRVETEWIRNNRGPAPDDILLGEFGNKLDED